MSPASGVVATTDICTERWYLSKFAIVCVEYTAEFKRKRNTGDNAHDINLEYEKVYKMHAAIGKVADSADEALKMPRLDVDFGKFYTSTFAMSSLATSLPALTAAIYMLSF